jgi:hypothetical protein
MCPKPLGKHGCTFTAEEFGEVVQALPSKGGELSDDDLDAVVGGIIGDCGIVDMDRNFRPTTIGTFTRLRHVVSPIGLFPSRN